MSSILESWRKSATKRAEFAAMLEEPCMRDAVAIVKEAIFKPLRPPAALSPVDRMAWFGEMGLRREAYLEMLQNFLSLASLSPFKERAQELQKTKPWDTADKTAGERKIFDEFYSGAQPPAGAAGTSESGPSLEISEQPNPPPSTTE